MRIYDRKAKRILTEVVLYLTPAEMHELAGGAAGLVSDPSQHHTHVLDLDCRSEINLVIYTPDIVSQLDAESQSVIGSEPE